MSTYYHNLVLKIGQAEYIIIYTCNREEKRMIIFKVVILLIIFILCTYLGIIKSNKYKNRVNELKELKKGLNIFETKIKYTYEFIPEIFKEISNNLERNIANIFIIAGNKMQQLSAKEAWEYALENSRTSMNKEDIEMAKGLSKLLGKTNLEGQVSQIELTMSFLDGQIENAENEYKKNEKMYKTLRSSNRNDISNFTNISEQEKKYGY